MDNAYMGEMTHYNPNDPIGTGPYQYVSHVVGNEITFKRNPTYWRGPPPLDEVVFKVITTAQLATLALEKGTVDMVPEYLDSTSVDILNHQSGIKLYSARGADNYQAFFDFEKARRGGYKNAQDIRQGLADLINTAQLVPPLIGSFGTPATQPIPAGEAGYDPSIKPWPFDPTQGEKLLTAGGIPKGGTISLFAIQRTDLCAVATAFQSQLISLGYHATLQCLENEVAATVVQNYQWDMFFWHSGESNLAAATFADIWAITNVPNPPNDVFTLRDPQLQSVINSMSATTDTAKYDQLVQQASQIVVKQQIATIPLYFDTVWIAARSDVHGVVANSQDDYGLLMNALTTVWKSH
jgi:peptide/nickel transport system substrate-binding protein